MEALAAHAPDIAFLDIRIPGRSGLYVARAASGSRHIVFTTAHDSHAVAAFQAGDMGETIKLFSFDEVLFFQSDEKYTRVVTANNEAHLRKPLKEIAEGLDADEFWQVHRGLVVCAAAISRAQRDELGRITVQLKNHSARLAVSQAWAWRFKPM